jgi:DNA-directed RNA polymerase subunit H (RpoH/RPB5)
MSELLFNNINDFKLCLNTLINNNGLLDRRGFILNKSYKELDLEEINNYSSYQIVASKPESNDYLFIYFVNNSSFLSKTYKTKNKNIYEIEDIIKNLYNIDPNIKINIDLIVILTRSFKINTNILEKKIYEKIKVNKINIFLYNYLLFNISTHSLMPHNIKIISNKTEIDVICKNKNIDDKYKLPKIFSNDALSNFYGLKKGQLFEFKRPSKNAGIYIYYRVCINV